MNFLFLPIFSAVVHASSACTNPSPVEITRLPTQECTYAEAKNVFQAIEKNCINLVQELVQREPMLAGTLQTSDYLLNPLGYSVFLGRLEITEMIMKLGIPTNVTNAIQEKQMDLVELAVSRNDYDVLKLVIGTMSKDIREYAILSGDQVGAFTDVLLSAGLHDFPLQQLVSFNACASLERILPLMAADQLWLERLGTLAVATGNTMILEMLHSAKTLPLDFSVLSYINSPSTLELLDRYGADFSVRDAQGDSLFMMLDPSLWKLIAQKGADLNALNKDGDNAVSRMLRGYSTYDPIGIAQDLKLNFNQTYTVNEDGQCQQSARSVNLLYLAAKNESVSDDHLNMLLSFGLRPEDTLSNCAQVFHRAAQGNHFALMQSLIKVGVDVRNTNETRDFLSYILTFHATQMSENSLLTVFQLAQVSSFFLSGLLTH